MKDKRIFIPIVAVLIAFGLVIFFLERHHQGCEICAHLKIFTPDVIKHFILGFGAWALAVFIFLYALNTISILPPIGIMSLAAGFIFGPFLGTVGIMTGALIGTSATFFIARIFGQNYVEGLLKGKAKEFEEKLNRNGFVTILFLRLIPLSPWEVVNYAAGLSKIKYQDYILATMIGILPAVLIQTFFADSLTDFNVRDPQFIAAVSAFLLLLFVPVIYLAINKKKFDLKK